MGTFGDEFQVASTLRSTSAGTVDLTAANANSGALQEVINTLARRGGGFVYLPPGRYLLGRCSTPRLPPPFTTVDAGDIVVYDNVVLWFAPGAVLVPLGREHAPPRTDLTETTVDDADVRVEVRGAIRALRAQIFDVSGEATASVANAGRVIFVGSQVRELYPEWWGAASNLSSPRTSLALQACFDAAHRHRRRPLRAATGALVRRADGSLQRWHHPAIPVVLSGSYLVDRALNFGEAGVDPEEPYGPNLSGFVLRGDKGVVSSGAGTATLVGAGDGLPCLLSIHHVSGFRVEGVSINGGTTTQRCVWIHDPQHGGAPASFEGCAILGGTREGVQIDGRDLDASPDAAPVLLSFRQCRIETLSREVAFRANLRHVPGGTSLAGMRIDAEEGVLVDVSNCFATGAASPLFEARSGWILIQSCTTHMHRLEDPRPGREVLDEQRTTNGTDLSFWSSASRSVRPVRVWAGATVVDHECQSWQFLTTSPMAGRSPRRQSHSTVVINLNHTNASDARPDFSLLSTTDWSQFNDKPAIFWDGPGHAGADLILMGTLISARRGGALVERQRGNTGGTVHLVQTLTDPRLGRVYDLGLASRETFQGVVDHRMVPANNVYSAETGVDTVVVHRVPNLPLP